jgi:hypothetical protein
LIDNGSVAVVWHSDLKPHFKDNASLVLTYINAAAKTSNSRQTKKLGLARLSAV